VFAAVRDVGSVAGRWCRTFWLNLKYIYRNQEKDVKRHRATAWLMTGNATLGRMYTIPPYLDKTGAIWITMLLYMYISRPNHFMLSELVVYFKQADRKKTFWKLNMCTVIVIKKHTVSFQ
jgi:hypothetical protein